jgi:hypothetical protein
MAASRETSLDRHASAPRASMKQVARRLLLAALHWAPVWAPLCLAAELYWLGLRRARADEQRLDRAEAEVRARAAALLAEEAELRAEQRMLGDEIYRERVRRSLSEAGSLPLTLERARRGAEPPAPAPAPR